MTSMLELRDVVVAYGQNVAIKGISLRLERGEIAALLGRNGAGKSTTLRAISGLQRVKSGSIVLDGMDITNRPAHEIVAKGFGHVPEGRRVFATLTVDENLRLGGYPDRGKRKLLESRRDRVLGLFPRLAERQHQLAGTLSGGEQQMLAVGRALMHDPAVLALDEPSLGLAPRLVHTILGTLKEIAARGVGILLVEQNAREALRIADRAYVLELGTVTLSGKASELANDPRVVSAYLGGTVEPNKPNVAAEG